MNMHLDLEGYCDVDWVSSTDDRRSTSSYCVFVGVILSHGVARSKRLWLDLQQRPNIGQWHEFV
jgi:hypothetical protein